MLYLNSGLTKEEETIFANWLFYMDIRAEDICDIFTTKMSGKYKVDLAVLDNLLDTRIPEYDSVKCLYKGTEVSIKDVLEKHYHPDIAKVIEKLQ